MTLSNLTGINIDMTYRYTGKLKLFLDKPNLRFIATLIYFLFISSLFGFTHNYWCYSNSADPDHVDPVESACSGSALFVANDKTQPSRIRRPDFGDLI